MKIFKLLLSTIFFGLLITACTPPEEKAEEYYEKGRTVFYNNDPRNALIEFEKGLEFVPDHDRLLYESGNCYMNFRDYHTAIGFYDKAIESNPKYADAFFNRGQCWFYLNDRDLSCADWMKADSLGKPNLGDKIKHCN
ncbi:MAG: tetratricopeptide repeat protein [Bacteroidales bacterium]|nr:tetratricopeptide repeat protein [Bacteroidales bacterium]